MRILYIDEKTLDSAIISDYLHNSGIEIEYMPSPVNMDEMTYMTEFSTKLSTFHPDYVFGTVFYSFVSLACAVSDMRYRVWIISGYNSNNFDYQVMNDRDYIFVADRRLFDVYVRLGVKNVRYLPFSYEMLRKEGHIGLDGKSDEQDSDYDVIVITSCTLNESSINDVMPLLKDSTKGYLDAYVQSRKNDIRIDGIYSKFPGYIQSDIEEKYPIPEKSCESKSMRYDNTFLYPHIDRSLAVHYPLSLISIDALHKLAVYTHNGFPYYNEKMDVIPLSGEQSVEDQLSPATIAICIPGLQDGSGLPPYVHTLIKRGYAVIVSASVDKDVAAKYNIPVFSNSNALVKLVRLYLESEEKLQDLFMKQKEALEREMMSDKIEMLIFGC